MLLSRQPARAPFTIVLALALAAPVHAFYIESTPEIELDVPRALAVVGVGVIVALVLIMLLSYEAGFLEHSRKNREEDDYKVPGKAHEGGRRQWQHGRARRAVAASLV
ncbi:hypothetical protein CspeluHIS016_0305130 [Cutaneotrichosporon spelunceum]|uniref:Dolichol phosphate-mannose biosynthesis regulatory protein n=1 Tax=Cutaneotrichosporon spelunceum TaxID=1672016 RepID=A0AAD3TU47_9TREE|nr:hypothetical protein CspeluHIS016_0305130 [Cutaneotrichosporon spelunceum]